MSMVQNSTDFITNSAYDGVYNAMHSEVYNYSNIKDVCTNCKFSESDKDQCIRFCSNLYLRCILTCMNDLRSTYLNDIDLCENKKQPDYIFYDILSQEQGCYINEDINLNVINVMSSCSPSCIARRNTCLGICL